MKRLIASALVLSILSPSLLLAVDGDKAAYFGGSVAIFAGAKDPIEGRLDLTSNEALILRPEKRPFVGLLLEIPYTKIEELEYGQKAGRRVGAAIGYTVLLGPIGPRWTGQIPQFIDGPNPAFSGWPRPVSSTSPTPLRASRCALSSASCGVRT